MKTSYFNGKFKRHQTEYMGGDCPTFVSGPTSYFPEQTVTIIKEIPEVDDNEDTWDSWEVSDAYGRKFIAGGEDLHPHPQEAELNGEFIERLMTMGSPLMQAFVLQGVEQFAKQVLAADPATLDSPFISGQAWRECATFTLGNFVARDIVRKARDGSGS